jgi:limonene-1,2-epoxide hydrolase
MSALPGSEELHIASNDDGAPLRKDSASSRWREKRITLRINAVFEVVDGKIAAWREYYDRVDLARQLGIDPSLVVEG